MEDEERMRAIARQEAFKLFDEAIFVKHGQIEQIVDTAVKRTLQGFGVDIENPTEVQENFINLRSWSELKRTMSQALVTLLSRTIFCGIIALLVMGFYAWVNGGKPPP
jgi:hypothetical protein